MSLTAEVYTISRSSNYTKFSSIVLRRCLVGWIRYDGKHIILTSWGIVILNSETTRMSDKLHRYTMMSINFRLHIKFMFQLRKCAVAKQCVIIVYWQITQLGYHIQCCNIFYLLLQYLYIYYHFDSFNCHFLQQNSSNIIPVPYTNPYAGGFISTA